MLVILAQEHHDIQSHHRISPAELPSCAHLPLQGGHAPPVEQPAGSDEEQAEGQEAQVPDEWTSQIVTDVMDLEDLMIHEAFHHVEDPPAG